MAVFIAKAIKTYRVCICTLLKTFFFLKRTSLFVIGFSSGNNLPACTLYFPLQAYEDGGYIKLVVKEECKDHVPGPVQRVQKSFRNEVSDYQVNPLKTLC